MNLKNVFKRMLGTKAHPPHQPYSPTPTDNTRPYQQDNSLTYSESEVDLHKIAGIDITFGTQKAVQVDNNGNAQDISQSQSYIVGTNRRVSDIEDIGGICCFCQEQAMEIYKAGLISLQQAQLKSLFDKKSAMQCDICGIYTCSVHSRPTQTPEGIFVICAKCRDEIKRQQRRQRIIGFLLSPFMTSGDKG